MTRFGIDALVAIRLAEEGLAIAPQHALVAPSLMRSEVLAADALVALDPWLVVTEVAPTAPFDALLG